MHPPDELMVNAFLPAMRVMVARRLMDEGFSQGRISKLLGVTQASISLYVRSGKRATMLLQSLGVSEEEGERYASLLAEDLRKSPVYAVNTLHSIWSNMLAQGLLCPSHRTIYPSLAQCDVCMKAYGREGRGSEGAVDQMERAVKLVEDSSVFVRVMPEVSVNLAYADADASSAGQVVAIPGRIVRVKGVPRSFMRPEYGASTHLAEILLEVKGKESRVRAAINLRYDPTIEEVLKRLGLDHITIGPPYPRGRDPILEGLKQKLRAEPGRFDALVTLGGEGLEPGLYLFGTDAVQVAQLAMKIAKSYASAG